MFAFLAGTVLGTAMANAGDDGGRLFLELAQRVPGAGDTASGAGAAPGLELAFSVILRRVLEVSFCWALGLTGFSIVGFAAVSLYLGLSSAMILSSITMEKGLLGPFIYLAAMFPQAFIYIPVFLVLAFWALSREKRPHRAAFALLLAAAAGGGFLETYVNPWLLGIFL